ncbi:DNA/RNA helicase [Sporothrix brasiliensis 5110]|uniref:DNA 3'-5' helicase n=1 Tax=Sporothrix brasiliensis 5110 TaxID=1398154 RepID=A0A0C2EUV8_9PEZI|nr:DNA/RNA helicase [Sporothrix brasiliensis 5110]KIH90354.1 DNA/RNA helicase [Sporothrix brasiliensis 5110]
MTLNNLSEQLPWLLRNPNSTRPAGFPTSLSSASSAAASSLARPAGASSTAVSTTTPIVHSPTTAALISTFRKEPALSNNSHNSSNTTAVAATPRTSNATGSLTPALTGTTLYPSMRSTLIANSDQETAAAAAAAAATIDHHCPASSPTTPYASTNRTTTLTQQDAATRPPGTANAPSRATPAVPSSHTRWSKTPIAPSPYALDFGSDLDPDDFDSIVDLTTDDNTPSSSSPHAAPREDVPLWREDYASRPEPRSIAKRGKKRKSADVNGPPEKATPTAKRKARVEERQRSRAVEDEYEDDDSGSIGDFPDVNDLVSMVSSSPIRNRQTPAKAPGRTPAKTPAKSVAPTKTPRRSPVPPVEESLLPLQTSVTPQKKQKRDSTRSDIVMDSEDEFVTPPTRNASFVTCPNDSVMQDGNGDEIDEEDDNNGPPSPHSPTLRTAQRMADTPHKNPSLDRGTKTPSRSRALVAETEPEPEAGEEDAPMDSIVHTQQPPVLATAPAPQSEPEPALEQSGQDTDEGMAATQRPGVLAYWPALRYKQHGLEKRLRLNTMEYTKALREKWSPEQRMKIKGDKEPLLKEKQALDNLVNEFRSYATLYNDQEALLHTITEAYQSHQDTEEEEARLDQLTAELQDCEETLRGRLSAASIDPSSCPADFAAGSPNDRVVVPATQHPEGYVAPNMSRNNATTPVTPSQVVLQTQMPPPRQPLHQQPRQTRDVEIFRPPPPPPMSRQPPNQNMPDSFDDDDLFNGVENLPPMLTSNYNTGPSRPQQGRGPDLFSDFSDDVEMLQVAEHFEMQHSSSAETTSRRPTPARQTLAPTSGNAGPPPRELSRGAKKSAALIPRASQKASMPPELMRFGWSEDVRRALKDRFRMSGFRHNQLEAINATLSGKDAFVLMPTGGGKSLCYQLPAVVGSGKTRGVTIVISPLLSLMQDQVDHLANLNIAANSFNGSMPAPARQFIMDLFHKENPEHYLQLLYVTPEMVNNNQRFINCLGTLYRNKKLARIVIDEAHCVSQWGHDFRPDYKALGRVRRQFPEVPVMALTATATPNVIVDIQHNLSIGNCQVFSQSFNRPNLYYEVRVKGSGCIDNMAEMIRTDYNGQTGIVYTLSQKSTESIAKKLCDKYGISAHHYHAGMPAEDKVRIQRDWQRGVIKVVVATIAFGMGIDKPDVRFVVHYYLPKSLEGYYQETGRAGRDGQQSNCYLYFGYGDIKNLRKFITDSDGSEEQKQRQREMLNRMVDFCENQRDCRRTEILRYFGESFDPAECKKTCDNCKSDSKFNLTDFTKYAVAALRIVEAFKLATLVQCAEALMGSKRLPEDHQERLGDIYGIAKHLKKQDVHMMIYRLLAENALREVNKVNRMDLAIQYFELGSCADDFFHGRKKLQVVIKVNDIAAAVTAKTKTKKAAAKADDSATTKATKRTKATAKSKAVAGSSTAGAAAKKKRKTPAAVLDEAGVEDDENDGDTDFESFDGPVHRNGYARDNFVVSDNEEDVIIDENDDDDAAFEALPPRRLVATSKARQVQQLQQYAYQDTGQSRPVRKSQTTQRQRRLEELGGPIARDSRLTEANIDPIHADIIAHFADEARRLEEKIRNEKGLRILFTERQLREMAICWTDTLDKMRRIPDIDPDHVRRYGNKFLPLIKRNYSMYQEMMGAGAEEEGDVEDDGAGYDSPVLGPVTAARRGGGGAPSKAPSQADLDAVVDLISSDESDDDDDPGAGGNDNGYGGGGIISTSSHAADTWRSQLEALQSQPPTKGSRGEGRSGGGSRKFSKGGRKTFMRRGGSRSGSGSYSRGSRAASGGGGANGGGVLKRKSAASSGGASSSRGSGGSGIGMMPL